ncbi:hypothetical protein [Demequina sp. NBRC 110053]|nr:hypothetical protein [Demequina sp. NBRC 110053]
MSEALQSIALEAATAVGGPGEAMLLAWCAFGLAVGGAALAVKRRRAG